MSSRSPQRKDHSQLSHTTVGSPHRERGEVQPRGLTSAARGAAGHKVLRVLGVVELPTAQAIILERPEVAEHGAQTGAPGEESQTLTRQPTPHPTPPTSGGGPRCSLTPLSSNLCVLSAPSPHCPPPRVLIPVSVFAHGSQRTGTLFSQTSGT